MGVAVVVVTVVVTVVVGGLGSVVPGFAEDAFVDGLRPQSEVRRALALSSPALSQCAFPKGAGAVVVDVEVLAAGFVDRVAVIEGGGGERGGAGEACVVAALRAMPFKDRGREPPTHIVVRLMSERPPPGVGPVDVARAYDVARDEVARCAAHQPNVQQAVFYAHVVVRPSGAVARVDAIDDAAAALNDATRECIVRALTSQMRLGGGRDVDARVTFPVTFATRASSPPSSSKAAPPAKKGSPLDEPTLFRVLGCSGAFGG